MKRILAITMCALLIVLFVVASAFAEDIPGNTEEPTVAISGQTAPETTAVEATETEPPERGTQETGSIDHAVVRAAAVPDMGPLTDVSQLENYFVDETFRTIVYNALQSAGLVGATVPEAAGKTIPEILAMYTGDIKANGKGIRSAFGLQYLTSVETVNLSDNIIEDWTAISPSGTFSDDHYGYIVDGEYQNVTWDIGKNPIKMLPEDFGGRLVIKQPATKSSYYPDKDALIGKAFIRDEAGKKFYAVFDIGVCHIKGTSEDNDFVTDGLVELYTVNVSKVTDDLESQHPGLTCKLLTKPEVSANNQFMSVNNILLNEKLRLGIGTGEVLHYWTADEEGLITEGSQSFKYYLYPEITIYDRVTLLHHNTGSAFLIKTDSETGKTLEGAEYEVYKGDVKLPNTYISDQDGMVSVRGLVSGAYSFREIKAPEGYELDTTPISFQIVDPSYAHGTVDGGFQDVTASDGMTARAGTDEIFVAGEGTADMVLSIQKADPEKQFSVIVQYSSLATTDRERVDGKADEKPYTRIFSSAEEAQKDINDMKNANRIAGPITIDVEYAPSVTVIQADKPIRTQPPASPSSEDVTTKAPKTDDSASAVLCFTMCIGATLVILGMGIGKKRRRCKK